MTGNIHFNMNIGGNLTPYSARPSLLSRKEGSYRYGNSRRRFGDLKNRER
jgi:hypothetical protein